ncbi:uncharacterized protein LOC117652573 [Thrips palmi]|uniref:Uncharacterized protein LOC117652573 n=1 Tax=Thrips palmi TaxID=161013 RepID=A0A6P9A7H6_THRPL|nr:uncharacterized protein LOC117652573 [Thrips palmi]
MCVAIFTDIPTVLPAGDLYNALLLNVILGVADGAPVDGYQCPLEFITQGNTISPVHHHLALMARRRWPCITFMSRGTLSNPTERGRYHLVCPGDNVYCLGQCSGPRALRVWYYAFLGMTRKPGCVVVVPPELCRLVQFLCHTFTSRDICPLTGLNVRTDTVLASVSCNLYRAAADAQVVAKRLDF